MIADLFTANVILGILASGIRLATPYLYAAIGETFGQRSGVLNLGVEGQMLLGAFAGFYMTLPYRKSLAGFVVGDIGGCVDGIGDGIYHCHPACRTGHQWDRDLFIWLGDE